MVSISIQFYLFILYIYYVNLHTRFVYDLDMFNLNKKNNTKVISSLVVRCKFNVLNIKSLNLVANKYFIEKEDCKGKINNSNKG